MARDRSNPTAPITTGGILGPDVPTDPTRGHLPTTAGVHTPIDRIWPPDPSATVKGNSLGLLGALTRNPLQPLEVYCGTAYGVALDPVWSSPVATIGVSFSGSAPRASVYVLRPGDFLEVPHGFDRFWIHNADSMDTLSGLALCTRGFVSFLVTRAPGVKPRFASLVPHPLASVIAVTRGNGQFYTGSLRRIAMEAYPLDAGNAVVAGNVRYSARIGLRPQLANVPVGTVIPSSATGSTIFDATIPEIPAYPQSAAVPYVYAAFHYNGNDPTGYNASQEEVEITQNCGVYVLTVVDLQAGAGGPVGLLIAIRGVVIP